jgi:hypothetical protein
MSTCKLCSTHLDNDPYIVFCGVRCQWIYYQVYEKMNHAFNKSPIDNSKCSVCKHSYLDHTAAAHCESCNKCGVCNIVDELLLCDNCAEKIKSHQFDAIESARNIDKQLQSNIDFHNAATVPIIELKKMILADDNIVNKDEALKQELLTRYETFSSRIFELSNELSQLQLSKSVIRHHLDDLAHAIRNEERERMKIADSGYVPPVKKPVKPRLANTAVTEEKKKKSVFENFVTKFAEMNNVSETEARITLMQQMKKMNKELPTE